MEQSSYIGLAILGVALLFGVFFARKFLSLILLLGVIAASAWYFFFK